MSNSYTQTDAYKDGAAAGTTLTLPYSQSAAANGVCAFEITNTGTGAGSNAICGTSSEATSAGIKGTNNNATGFGIWGVGTTYAGRFDGKIAIIENGIGALANAPTLRSHNDSLVIDIAAGSTAKTVEFRYNTSDVMLACDWLNSFIRTDYPIKMKERATMIGVPEAGYGFLWNKTTDSRLHFTDDSSADHTIAWTSEIPSITPAALTEATSSVLVISSGGATALLQATSIQVKQAGVAQAGYLSSTDWNTFNNKTSSQWTTTGSDIYYTTGNVFVGGSTTLGATYKIQAQGGAFAQIDTDNTSANKDVLGIARGTGAGTAAFIQSSGDASNGVANVSLKLGGATRWTVYNSNRVDIGAASTTARNLNISSGATSVNLQFTSTVTGTTATDGFLVGIDTSGNAELVNFENTSLNLKTNNTPAVEITNAQSLNALRGFKVYGYDGSKYRGTYRRTQTATLGVSLSGQTILNVYKSDESTPIIGSWTGTVYLTVIKNSGHESFVYYWSWLDGVATLTLLNSSINNSTQIAAIASVADGSGQKITCSTGGTAGNTIVIATFVGNVLEA